MKTQLQQVKDFHNKLQVSPTSRMCTNKLPRLYEEAMNVAKAALYLQQYGKFDERYNRVHLIFEEAAEFAVALATGDECAALDGLSDLLYVVFGSAIAFDLPLDMAFDEVHRSNMTKEKQPNDAAKHRVRVKGPNYSPPNLKRILLEYRNEQKNSK